MRLERFDPPGFLEDYSAEQKASWSAYLSEQFDLAVQGQPHALEFDGPRQQFYNPMKTDTDDADMQAVDITWTAFPKNVTVSSVSDLQRWRRADASRDVQDEYCEWSVDRDPVTQKIVRVTFTCEGPEYWQFLAQSTPDVALGLYRQFISNDIEPEDLFDTQGHYNLRNRWNNSTVNGAMHLIQTNNTLSAEIELAGGSSVVREINGRILMGEQELIRCGSYGGVNRHSDPHIGALVNSLTRKKAEVTLANPLGLYFNDLNTAGWVSPDGSNPKLYWSYVRGTAGHEVRAVYEVPAGKGFVVGDIQIGGRPIEFGAQIADFITMKLTGIGTRFGKSMAAPMTGCRRPRPADEAIPAVLSVSDALVPPRRVTR